MFSTNDTIVAPVTAVGSGGVAIIRLSGSESVPCMERFFRPAAGCVRFTSHRLYYGHFCTDEGRVVDEVMAVYMQHSRSYTCEDVVEIHCHGGRMTVSQIIDTLLSASVRLAEPGEFTFRAFINGRIDLSEAEAVADLINSRSAAARDVAINQLSGALSRQMYQYRERLLSMAALVEAYIDFPEEDMEAPHLASLIEAGNELVVEMTTLLDQFEEGRLLREGLSVLILGKPNVGKSSLLNMLLGQERAIVTDIPGTTRDIIQESIVLDGIPLTLIDTAGIRQSDDPIESTGVERAISKIDSADIVLYLIDGTQPYNSLITEDLQRLAQRPTVVIVNKADQANFCVPLELTNYATVQMSAKHGQGLDQLKARIFALLNLSGGETRESVLLSDRRHRDALQRTVGYLATFLEELQLQASDEFLSIHLRDALDALGEITGETTPDEILNSIFSRFCIGK